MDAVNFRISTGESPSRVLGAALLIVGAATLAVVSLLLVAVPHVLSSAASGISTRFVVYVPLALCTLAAVGALLGIGAVREYNIVRFAAQSLITVTVIALYAAGHLSASTGANVYIGTEFVTVSLAWWLLKRRGVTAGRPRIAAMRRLGSYGARVHLSNMSGLLNERGDQLLLSTLIAPRELGAYVVAVSLSAPVGIIGVSLAPAILARTASEATPKRFPLLAPAGLAISLALLGVLVAPTAIHWGFGYRYPNLVGLTQVLLIAAVPLTITRLLGATVKGLGQPGRVAIAELVALAVATAILLSLRSWLGAGAAALGSLVGYSLSAVLLAWIARRASPCGPG
jgi:O-antigen/teichoic acid export membrane protein